MVLGWRRAFCTSIPKERESTTISSSSSTTTTDKHQQQQQQHSSSSHSPRISSKFGFFSNPSTPRLQSQPVSSPSLRCRTTTTAPPPNPSSSVPNSPKLQCQTKKSISPRLFHFSSSSSTTPPSPKSPSSFSFLKASLRLSKNSSRCTICLQSVKSEQGTAIFTAECNHVFHFACVASHVKKNHLLVCPDCNTTWKEPPLLSFHPNPDFDNKQQHAIKPNNFRVYNDDEPLGSPSPASLFNPIPEEEDDDVTKAEHFQGFFVSPAPPPIKPSHNATNIQVRLLPESAVVAPAAAGRTYETHVGVIKVRAPAARGARRAPIDLVTVLDVSERMCGAKSRMMKRALRLVISSLGSADRLSIVAFSATSKRLLPLRRMTASGRRSARRIVEALGSTGQGMSASDALKKAAKVIEDRREKNPFASIVILSTGEDDRSHTIPANQRRLVTTTHLPHLDIPVHWVGLGGESSACFHPPEEDALAKSISGLLTVVVQDVKLQLGLASGSARAEIAAVYSLGGRAGVFGPGSVRLGDLHAEEEREVLLEMRVPAAASLMGSHQILLSVRSSFRDASSQQLIFPKELPLLAPRAQAFPSSLPAIQRLRNLHVTTRAVAESGRLIERCDLSGAYHLLSSARALLMQSADGSAGEYLRGLEAELAELNRRRQQLMQSQRHGGGGGGQQVAKEKPEPLTPTSAWRAAERLAKVAITRKHMNRVSDLHGFESARF